MRWSAFKCLTAVLWCLAASAATAQDNSVAIPPAPGITPAPPSVPLPPAPPPATPPPGLVPTPAPAANSDTDTGIGTPPPAMTPPPAETPPMPPNTWLPGSTAVLGVLDKVDGSAAAVSIPVNGQATVGDLLINVLACVNRPADQIPDAAVFIAASAAGNAAPVYRGWMVRSVPGASVVGDASETLRVIGCS